MAEFDNETFEPVEPTEPQEPVAEPVAEPAVAEPQSTEPVSTEEPAAEPQEPVDNWEVRARYQQSEADKFKNIVQSQNEKIQQMLDMNKPKPVEQEMPQEPDSDDPNEWVQYNAKMNKFILNEMNTTKKANQKKDEQAEEQRLRMAQREQGLGKMTEVTKSPEKSQKILDFFVDTQNFRDPAVYNIMYDAAMGYFNQKPSLVKPNIKAPPPPTGGGEAVNEDTPDDEFNKNLGQQDRYKL